MQDHNYMVTQPNDFVPQTSGETFNQLLKHFAEYRAFYFLPVLQVDHALQTAGLSLH